MGTRLQSLWFFYKNAFHIRESVESELGHGTKQTDSLIGTALKTPTAVPCNLYDTFIKTCPL